MKSKFLKILGIATLGIAVLTGCGGNTIQAGDGHLAKGKIVAVGSTTVAVPMEGLVEKYKEVASEVVVEVQGVGSSAGVKSIADGTADIGMVSRQLKESEQNEAFVVTTMAYDGIAIVVNPANGITNLTSEEVKAIFEGTITNWSQVGGKDQQIIVVSREDGSGTRSAFEEILKLEKEMEGKKVSSISEGALIQEGNGTMKATISSKEGAIGFVSLGFIDDTVKSISVDGIKPTVETVKDGSYSISRPLLLVTHQDSNEQVTKFMDFILSDAGQEVVSEQYIPVN